ncbi:hypothetical protein [Algibacter sp. L1A34]|nr:hypothetical protein [Algibacter sp. L1A34]
MKKSIGFILIILNCFQVFSSEIKTIKKVNNVKDFFAALGNNTEVVITCETLDFTLGNLEKELSIEETSEFWASRVESIKRAPQSYYLDYGIVLYGFNNLTVRGEVNTNIISNDDYRVVLNFKKCNNIVLENLKNKYVITIETDDNSLIKLNITFNEDNKIVKLEEQIITKTSKK